VNIAHPQGRGDDRVTTAHAVVSPEPSAPTTSLTQQILVKETNVENEQSSPIKSVSNDGDHNHHNQVFISPSNTDTTLDMTAEGIQKEGSSSLDSIKSGGSNRFRSKKGEEEGSNEHVDVNHKQSTVSGKSLEERETFVSCQSVRDSGRSFDKSDEEGQWRQQQGGQQVNEVEHQSVGETSVNSYNNPTTERTPQGEEDLVEGDDAMMSSAGHSSYPMTEQASLSTYQNEEEGQRHFSRELKRMDALDREPGETSLNNSLEQHSQSRRRQKGEMSASSGHSSYPMTEQPSLSTRQKEDDGQQQHHHQRPPPPPLPTNEGLEYDHEKQMELEKMNRALPSDFNYIMVNPGGGGSSIASGEEDVSTIYGGKWNPALHAPAGHRLEDNLGYMEGGYLVSGRGGGGGTTDGGANDGNSAIATVNYSNCSKYYDPNTYSQLLLQQQHRGYNSNNNKKNNSNVASANNANNNLLGLNTPRDQSHLHESKLRRAKHEREERKFENERVKQQLKKEQCCVEGGLVTLIALSVVALVVIVVMVLRGKA